MEEKQIKELMKPRYKVIADYPLSPYTVGELIPSADLIGAGLDEWPHLFKRLEWWEDRQSEELPEYVKDDLTNIVYKVISWDGVPDIRVWNPVAEYEHWDIAFDVTPATESDYQTYLQNKKP